MPIKAWSRLNFLSFDIVVILVQPSKFIKVFNPVSTPSLPMNFSSHPNSVTAEDIAEEIVWAAARPPHVNIASMLVFPTNQASAGIKYSEPGK